MSKILMINSADRIQPEFSNSTIFRIAFNKPIENLKSVTLTNAIIPNTFYNVYDYTLRGLRSANDFLVVEVLGTPFLVPLVTGSYNITDFMTMIVAQLNANAAPYTFTASYDVNKLFITVTCSDPFRFLSQYLSGGVEYNDFNALYNMGFLNPLTNVETPALTQTGTMPPRLDLPDAILIKIVNLQANVFTTENDSACFYVATDTTSTNVVYFQNTYPELTKFNFLKGANVTCTYFDVIMTDQYQRILDLNGADWSFNLCVETYI